MYNLAEIASLAVSKHQAQQDTAELALLLDLTVALHDDWPGRSTGLALELGHAAGGTAWALSCVGFRVISVDPDPECPPAQTGNVLIRSRSQDASTHALVTSALAGRMVDLLLIDGDRTQAAAETDWHTYRHLVRPNGLVAIHDAERQDGVKALVAKLRTDYPVVTLCTRPGDSPSYAFYRN